MKYFELQNKAAAMLQSAGFENSRNEALILLKYVYNINDNDWPLLAKEDAEGTDRYFDLIKRRETGEPIQYIIGFAYFYGRKFIVKKGVLIPRYDTETICQEAIKEAKSKTNVQVLDMCAGSGCIGITIALEATKSKVMLADIDPVCLNTIEENAKALNAQNITIIYSNLFLCIDGLFDIITINPPYISREEYIALENEVADFEPRLALYGGEDGLEYYREIAKSANKHLKNNGLLLLEIGFEQAEAVTDILSKSGFKNITTVKDIAGRDRVISARWLL